MVMLGLWVNMAKYAWMTDLHLDHVDVKRVKDLFDDVAQQQIDGLFITGDVSNSRDFVAHLAIAEAALNKPILYVLGNHDMWGSSVEAVHKRATELSTLSTFIKWAASTPYIPLTTSTALVGHDGWYDALYGDPDWSFGMNDWTLMGDFRGKSKDSILSVSRTLSHAGALSVMKAIKAATRHYKHLIVLTHVPPFKCHECDSVGLSWFMSKMMGDMLLQAAKSYPGVQFTVLTGHSHRRGVVQPEKNLICRAGMAEYGRPCVECIIEVI